MISTDDYFRMNDEFRHWLSQREDDENRESSRERKKTKKRSLRFMDLSDREAKKLFRKFVRRWNDGRLDREYYDGKISRSTETNASERTSYRWGFAAQLDDDERARMQLDTIRDEVDHVTYGSGKNEVSFRVKRGHGGSGEQVHAGDKRGRFDDRAGDDDDLMVTEEGQVLSKREMEYKRRRYEDKQFSKRMQEGLDEIAPRSDPDSFQRRLEKRQQRSQYTRGGGNDDFGEHMMESELMGDDGRDDFAALVRRERERRAEREQRKGTASGSNMSLSDRFQSSRR